MNRLFMTGRLTKDPEVRYTAGENNTAVANFGIAVDRRGTKDVTDFFNCAAFGKTAEHIGKYWKKGMKAAISGRLETDNWTGKDGVKRTNTKIVVEDIEFCEKKQEQAPEKAWEPMDEVQEDLPFKF